jgi:fermentation-respiration switch protein FrsA (DUF1100 family)
MKAAVTLLAVAAAFLVFVWVTQRRLIYFPSTQLPAPSEVGLASAEPVSFATGDGLRLTAWLVPASGAPHLTVLVFNGNAGNRAYRAPLAMALRDRGCQVLLTDYRGYAGNPGAPSEPGLLADARAALSYLLSRPDVNPDRLVYFGESLGSGVAIQLAVERPPAALIVRSPFTSLVDIGRHHYPLLPVRLLLRDRFASIERAPLLRSPTLVIAGTRDSIVPIDDSRRFFDIVAAPKTFVEIRDADHNDDALLIGDEMLEAIDGFLRRLH